LVIFVNIQNIVSGSIWWSDFKNVWNPRSFWFLCVCVFI